MYVSQIIYSSTIHQICMLLSERTIKVANFNFIIIINTILVLILLINNLSLKNIHIIIDNMTYIIIIKKIVSIFNHHNVNCLDILLEERIRNRSMILY